MKQLLFITILLLAACTTGNVVQEDVVTIGVITPLSGFTAETGENVKKGLELGREYVARAGVNIKFVYEDGQCSGNEAVKAFNKLRLHDIKIITGFVCSSEVLPIAPLLEDEFLIPVTSSSPLISDASDQIFRVAPNDFEDALLHFNYIQDQYATNEPVGIVYIENDYGVSIKDILVSRLEAAGYSVIVEGFSYGETDFKTTLLKLDVPVISLIAYPENSLVFMKALKEHNKQTLVLGTFATLSDESFDNDLLDNYLVTNFGESNDEFERLYWEKYNEEPVMYSNFAYDSVLVIAELVKAGEVTPEAFAAIDIVGATGRISFDEHGDRKGLVSGLYKINDGIVCEYGC